MRIQSIQNFDLFNFLDNLIKMPVLVSLIGVGLVGQEVIQQLAGLKEFRIYSLSNSKYTISSDTIADLFPLLPSSSAVYSPSTIAGVKIEKNDHAALIAGLGKNHIIIDCTASLDIPMLYSSALLAGISIVTPNKKGLSSQASLYESIQSSLGHGGLLYCEATVGAGLPIISTLKDLLQTGDKIHKIEGVLSGTLSYIFNEFSTVGGSTVKFSEVVKKAKDLGYTVRTAVPRTFSKLTSFIGTTSSR